MSADNGGAAFPLYGSHGNGHLFLAECGMTLRDYMAAKALQGLLSNLPESMYGIEWEVHVSSAAYRLADEMLRERAK